MNEEQQKYCDDMRDLFLTPGWEWIKTDLQYLVNQNKTVENIKTVEELHFAKGVLYACSQIIALPDIIRDAEEEDESDI